MHQYYLVQLKLCCIILRCIHLEQHVPKYRMHTCTKQQCVTKPVVIEIKKSHDRIRKKRRTTPLTQSALHHSIRTVNFNELSNITMLLLPNCNRMPKTQAVFWICVLLVHIPIK